MNITEREMFALQGATRIGEALNLVGWEVFGDALKHKLMLALSAIDHVSAQAPGPVLIDEVIPGIDLVVAKPRENHVFAIGTAVIDPRALTPIDPRNLELLSAAVRTAFEGNGGAGVFESVDGTHYVVFPTARRDEALASMGISSSSVDYISAVWLH